MTTEGENSASLDETGVFLNREVGLLSPKFTSTNLLLVELKVPPRKLNVNRYARIGPKSGDFGYSRFHRFSPNLTYIRAS